MQWVKEKAYTRRWISIHDYYSSYDRLSLKEELLKMIDYI